MSTLILLGGCLAARAQDASVRATYNRCEGCHSPDRNRTGPMLGGLFARSAGAVPDFDYSPAFAGLTFRWDNRNLDRFLEDPQAFAPGNKMEFSGVTNPAERHALIEYLRRVLDK